MCATLLVHLIELQLCHLNQKDRRSTDKAIYTKEDVTEALSLLGDGGYSIADAASMFNIPRKTLSDRFNNGKHQKTLGHPTILTSEEETYLVIYIYTIYG